MPNFNTYGAVTEQITAMPNLNTNCKLAKLYLILIRTERLRSNFTIVVTKLGN